MRPGTRTARRKAAVSGALLLATGMIAGATIDRVLTGRASVAAAPSSLTVESMSEALDLDTADRDRVRALLDSVESDVVEAASAGSDSLRAVSRLARERLEQALPPDRRDRFQRWMREHHNSMMEGMRTGGMGRMMGGGMMGRGMRGAERTDSTGTERMPPRR